MRKGKVVQMMKRVVASFCAVAACAAFAEPSGDRPDETHAWAVHDVNRPDPVKITVPQGGIPSDAIVLFDGTQDSVDRNWCGTGGKPTKWTVKDGTFVCTPGSGSVLTKENFGDCQLHIEWMTPVDDVEGWGNSGVILMGRYEIQILDSSAVVPSKSPWKPANYADGQAGAVYGQNPALVNPCRKPGEWQSYDIVFHPPRREGGRLVDTGSFTVFFNGVLVQDNWSLQGMTTWCRRLTNHIEVAEAPLRLQDHGHPVPFRNIWIRRIPARQENTVSGGPYAKRGDVAKLRHELAIQSRAFAGETEDAFERYIRLWESFCYEPDRDVKAQLPAAEAACVAALAANDPKVVVPYHVSALRRFVKMLVAGGWMPQGGPLEKALKTYRAPPKPAAPNMRDF